MLAELEERWSVRVGAPVAGGSASYVARAATPDGAARVVKVGLPDPGVADEARGLRVADGRGAAVLHDWVPEREALLLESLEDSLDRTPRPVEVQLDVLTDVLADFWRPAGAGDVPPAGQDKASALARLVLDLDEQLGRPCPRPVRDEALRCAEARAAVHRPETCVVAHGDPHPANLLRVVEARPGAEHGWVFVDPEHLVVEREYDLGVVLRGWTASLGASPRPQLERWCGRVAGRAGADPRAVWEWAFLERVSTGLYVLGFGAAAVAEPYLRSAAALLR